MKKDQISPDSATAADLEHAMLAQANPADAEILMRFFKTGPGQYGKGIQGPPRPGSSPCRPFRVA